MQRSGLYAVLVPCLLVQALGSVGSGSNVGSSTGSSAGSHGVAAKQPLALGDNMNPVKRIVELLIALREQAEMEAKADEKLYDKFVCWGTQVLAQKRETNRLAQKEIDELRQYVADLDAGRIEFTTERVDLEKEIADFAQSIQIATAAREKENADYENAVSEMQYAIDALESALEVLKTATAGHESGVLMSVHGGQAHTLAAFQAEAASLSRAVQLGDKFLSKGDSLYLRRLLTGEVPTWDWRKLNRKATFKMSYKARSFKIQDVLAKLLQTFTKNRDEAIKKENDAKALFDKLMESKEAGKKKAEEALIKMEKETGARGLSRVEATDQIAALEAQIKNDDKYIEQVEKELDDKKTQWQDRANLRYGEIAAISKAIEVLHNDEARDMFKRSMASQGYSFTQLEESTALARAHQEAAWDIRQLAQQVNDTRLVLLAQRVSDPLHFEEVISAIDTMVITLQGEAKSDVDKKEDCEQTRAKDTRDAILAARKVDEHTDVITKFTEAIAKIEATIKEKNEQTTVIDDQLAAAKTQRDEEHALWLKTKADDEKAEKTVGAAMLILQQFYKESGLMSLVQKKNKFEPVTVKAGEAPPPPPTTWDAPYMGKTAEATGVIAILSMIKEDILYDAGKAKEAEDCAQRAYDNATVALEEEKRDLGVEINDLTSEKSGKDGDIITETTDRKTEKDKLDIFLDNIKGAEPGCNYFTVNFVERNKNRHIEIDGLLKAKAVLQGARFDALDPNRALRPGDALLLRVRRH